MARTENDGLDVQRAAYKENKKKDCTTLFYIQQNVDNQHFENISKATRSKEAWDILENYHNGREKVKEVKLQSYRRKYKMMQMEEDQKQIQEAKDVKTMKIEELQSSLEAHELLVIDRGPKRLVQQALQAQTIKKEGNYKNFKKGKGKTNWSNNVKSKAENKSESSKRGSFGKNQNKKKDFDKSKVQCYNNCDKFGQFADECWFKKDQKTEEANIAHV
ncbi:uncharacterized protein [Medicago truncatula]|uniref:uncharacterized protein n=1 Tax=Medicago truncatula TaxID=3880 RepID=UPI000D2F35F8|nr:uncharacterized protein LOC112420747 [Medicago truncatula]